MAKKKKENKGKKIGFLKRQKAKKEKKKRQRQELLKNIISPMKQLKALDADQIKEHLEDSPLLQSEPEIAEILFSEELVVKNTNLVLERYKERFEAAQEEKQQKKRELYEDFCMEVVSKMVNKPFIISLQRRLRFAAKRLKAEKNPVQMMRAIVCEATMNIPQIPIEAHPLLVGIYEDIRKKALGEEFNIKGFEDLLQWQDRVAAEREKERTVKMKMLDPDKCLEILDTVDEFRKEDAESITFSWLGSEIAVDDAGESATEKASEKSLLGTIRCDGDKLTLIATTVKFAKEGETLLMNLLGSTIEKIDDEEEDADSSDETSDENDTEGEDATETVTPSE